MDLALDNLQRLICHKTQTNKQIGCYLFKNEFTNLHYTHLNEYTYDS